MSRIHEIWTYLILSGSHKLQSPANYASIIYTFKLLHHCELVFSDVAIIKFSIFLLHYVYFSQIDFSINFSALLSLRPSPNESSSRGLSERSTERVNRMDWRSGSAEESKNGLAARLKKTRSFGNREIEK